MKPILKWEEEVKNIRRKMCKLMGWWVTLTMEYASLTHYDVLQKKLCFFDPLQRCFYWYTMEIALRGYEMKQ